MKAYPILLSLLFAVTACSENEQQFTVQAPDFALAGTPVYADIETGSLEDGAVVCLQSGGQSIPGQVEAVSNSTQRIWWIAGQAAGSEAVYALSSDERCDAASFSWGQPVEDATVLSLGDQPVIRYEHPVFDSGDIEGTKKPFHQVYAPGGNRLITKGTGGLFPHHRGIYFGYNHVYVDERQIDIWHARNGERSEHFEVVKEFEGPVMGGHIVTIHWKDHDGEPFLEETREIRVFRQPRGESLIDLQTTLHAIDKPVSLGGDRQHAGVQFRAAQYTADNDELTKFIRPAGLSHLAADEEIDGDDMMDLTWNAMHFNVDGNFYTTAYLTHPDNPEGAEMSERLYGRFGEFIPHELTADNPLQLKYRFWIKEGDQPAIDDIELRYAPYANPVRVQTTN